MSIVLLLDDSIYLSYIMYIAYMHIPLHTCTYTLTVGERTGLGGGGGDWGSWGVLLCLAREVCFCRLCRRLWKCGGREARCSFIKVSEGTQSCTYNVHETISKPQHPSGLDVNQSPNAQDVFQPIPGLFGMCWDSGVVCHAHAHNYMYMYSMCRW